MERPTKKFAGLAVFAATLLYGASAQAATYVGSRSLPTGLTGPASATLSLTTNDTIGSLQLADLLAWSIQITDALGSATLDQTNSTFEFGGSGALVASASDISFDFDNPGAGYVIFRQFGGGRYYCVQTNGNCLGTESDGEALDANVGTGFAFAGREGNVTLATLVDEPTGAVPEPSTWALMLIGFAFVGSSLRRSKQAWRPRWTAMQS